jgi:hypothetical protein
MCYVYICMCLFYSSQELTAANASELVVGNVVRRVLFIIREEYSQKLRYWTYLYYKRLHDGLLVLFTFVTYSH